MGSLSGWLMLFGIMARPLWQLLRTNSGVIFPDEKEFLTISFVLALHGFGLFVY
jgi:hypothetical protein